MVRETTSENLAYVQFPEKMSSIVGEAGGGVDI